MKTLAKLSITAISLILALGVVLSSPSAHAVDRKNYPASNCVVDIGPNTLLRHDPSGSVWNASKILSLRVNCPISGADPTKFKSGWIKVTDRNDDIMPQRNYIECWLSHQYRIVSDSSLFAQQFKIVRTASSASNSLITLNFPGNPFVLLPTSYLSYTCWLPPLDKNTGQKSEIHYYGVIESE